MNAMSLLRSTSNRTFLVLPLLLLAAELLLTRGRLQVQPAGALLMLWGYAQYRLAGNYRTRMGGGGPGLRNPPERLVTSGIFAYTRNPMYLGHLIFIAGLAIALRSYLGAALLIAHVPWFQMRVLRDEARLREMFDEQYAAYTKKVKRWIPYTV